MIDQKKSNWIMFLGSSAILAIPFIYALSGTKWFSLEEQLLGSVFIFMLTLSSFFCSKMNFRIPNLLINGVLITLAGQLVLSTLGLIFLSLGFTGGVSYDILLLSLSISLGPILLIVGSLSSFIRLARLTQ